MKNIMLLPGSISLSGFCLLLSWSCSGPTEKYQPKSDTVVIEQMRFQPALLNLHTGDTVVWINKDFVDHDVTQIPDGSWKSSPLASGKSWSLVVQQSADYYCSIHKVMKGRLEVK